MAPELIEHHYCPAYIARSLEVAGGKNRFGEANFRVIWGFDRIAPIHGQWEEYEETEIFDPTTISLRRKQITLKRTVVETRHVPKYLPGNCWHLESWRPPEEYGSPEDWGKLGEEVYGCMTVDTSGPYPSMGEYELCFPLTSDWTSTGTPIPLVNSIVESIVAAIKASKENFSYAQRRAAIEQEHARKELGFTRKAEDQLRDGLRPYHGNEFVAVPQSETYLPDGKILKPYNAPHRE